jgi:hypothetical protein
MAERMGPRRPDEIEKEPPKEAPYIQPTDQPSDTTPSNVGDDIGDQNADNASGTLPRLEPFGPGDLEAQYWNNEADAIEEWAAQVGDPQAYTEDVGQRMYEPSDVPLDDTPADIGDDIGGDIGSGAADSGEEP